MTTKVPLIINRLKIDKMPGFPRGLDGYDKLAPSINIIAGPNASGKSSTARIIQQIFWHNHLDGIRAEASLSAGSEPWEVKIDSNYLQVQHDGRDAELSGLPAAEGRGRYMLALHELVKEDETELARQIIRESVGGYDIDEARNMLLYSPQVRKKSTSEYQEFEKAAHRLRKVDREHSALKEEENRLVDLYKQKKKTAKAEVLKDLYQKAQTFLAADNDLRAKSEVLKTFPEVLEKTTGQEYKQISEIEQEIQRTETEAGKAAAVLDENRRILSDLSIPPEGIANDLLNELESRIDELTDLEREMKENRLSLETARIREKESLKSLGDKIDPAQWKRPDVPDITELDEFLQKVQQLISDKLQWESRIKDLKSAINDTVKYSPDTLNEGIRTLSSWLQEREVNAGSPSWTMPVMVLIVIMTGLLAYFSGWIWLAGPVLALLVTFFSRGGKEKSTGNIREEDYTKTRLPEPETWTPADVTERLDELTGLLVPAKMQERIRENIAEYEKQLEKLDGQLNDLDQVREKWQKKVPSVPENYSGLYWFLIHLRKWQDHHEEAQVLGKKTGSLDEMITDRLEQINRLLHAAGSRKVTGAAGAKSLFRVLRSEENKRREMMKEAERISRNIAGMKDLISRNKAKMKTLYDKTGIEEGNIEAVKHINGMIDAYTKAKNAFELARGMAAEKKQILEDNPLFDEHIKDIHNIELETVREKLAHYTAEAGGLDALNRTIHTIEANIDRTKKEHDLEDALAAKDAALDNLSQRFQENLSSVTGNLIVDHLKKVTSEQNRPAVYRKAEKLLNRITRGRYELRLEEKGEPAFRAYDTSYRTGQNLGELSTGTRIQLLMAVRLAFIEIQEPALKLPVLADELLANSDDVRAAAIIEALAEISKQGRQIFYFTAQDDEVARWKKHLSDFPPEDFRIIRLASGTADDIPEKEVPRVPSFIFRVPEPGTPDHEAYGKILGVPRFNLLRDDPAQLHLWYLTEDDHLLFRLLSNGLSCYGQLESFLEHGGEIRDLSPGAWQEIKNRNALLIRFLELYQTGRPKPVDRQTLERSGAVSVKFIDEVSFLLETLSYDPQKLTEALQNGTVTGFRQNKTEQLKEFLMEEGYIDTRPPFDDDQIWLRLKAFLSRQDMEARNAEIFLKRIVEHEPS